MQHNDILTCDFNEQLLNKNEFLHIEGQIKAERLIILLLIFFNYKKMQGLQKQRSHCECKKLLTVLRLYIPCLDIIYCSLTHLTSDPFPLNMSLVAACGATSLKSITSASSLSFLGTTVSMKPPLQTKINTRHTGINHYITALDLLVHLI